MSRACTTSEWQGPCAVATSLAFLGSRNVLPKYGFPTDVVEMRTNHLPVPAAGRIELQRDLRIAIAEYAPGGEVVAAKHIWASGGLNKRLNRDWPTYHYAVCPECGRFHRSATPIEGPCSVRGCGANLFGWPRRYGTFVSPRVWFHCWGIATHIGRGPSATHVLLASLLCRVCLGRRG